MVAAAHPSPCAATPTFPTQSAAGSCIPGRLGDERPCSCLLSAGQNLYKLKSASTGPPGGPTRGKRGRGQTTTRAMPGTIEISSSLLLDCAWAVLESWNNQEPQPWDRLNGWCPCCSLSWEAVAILLDLVFGFHVVS